MLTNQQRISSIITCFAVFFSILLVGCQEETRDISGVGIKSMSGEVVCTRLTEDYWQLWKLSLDGSSKEQLTFSLSDKRNPVFGKEGKFIYYKTNNSEAFRVDVDSKVENRSFAEYGNNNGGVIPSPKGDLFAVVIFRSQLRDSCDIWLVSLDGKVKENLTREAGVNSMPSWSPDGKKLVYVHSLGYKKYELCILDIVTRKKTKLTSVKDKNIINYPAFSPDGKTIAYSSDISGNYEIWLYDIARGSRTRLTENRYIDTYPTWSPSGNQILFTSARSGSMALWIMNRDGSDAKQVTDEIQTMDPCWSKR